MAWVYFIFFQVPWKCTAMLLTSILHKNVSTKLHRKRGSQKALGESRKLMAGCKSSLCERLLAPLNRTWAPEESLLFEEDFSFCYYKYTDFWEQEVSWGFIMRQVSSFPTRHVLWKASTFRCEFVLTQKNNCHTSVTFSFWGKFLCKTFWLIFLKTRTLGI